MSIPSGSLGSRLTGTLSIFLRWELIPFLSLHLIVLLSMCVHYVMSRIQSQEPRSLGSSTMVAQLPPFADNLQGVNAEVTPGKGDAQEIDRVVREALEQLNGNNGLVLSAMIFRDVPTETVMTFIDIWRKYNSSE